jgi:hypothetical protein
MVPEPRNITIARVALVISVGLTVIAAIQLSLGTRWSEMPSTAALVVRIIVVALGSVLAIAFALFPLWLIRRGSRFAAPVASLSALVRVVLCLSSIDAVGALTVVLSLIPAVLLWLPDSRRYLRSVTAERAEARQMS